MTAPEQFQLPISDTRTSRECRQGQHTTCTGFYGTNGSTTGYDTYTCWCRHCDHHKLTAHPSGVNETAKHHLTTPITDAPGQEAT